MNKQVGVMSAKDWQQALRTARAVEDSGRDVFSVTASDGVWLLWFRFDESWPMTDISIHCLRHEKEHREFERQLAANRTARGRKPSAKPKPKNLGS